MYRIIGIIALVGTLAGCPNPTTEQPDSKTFEGEYKIILQSGPFRGPLDVRYGSRVHVEDDAQIIRDASKLPWSARERSTVSRLADDKFPVTTIIVLYSRPSGFTRLNQETVYRLEIWIDGTLKGTKIIKITDTVQNFSESLFVRP